MKYLRLENGIVAEIIPEFNPLFPNVAVDERYPKDFLRKLVSVNDDAEVYTGMSKTENGYCFLNESCPTSLSFTEMKNAKIKELSDECGRKITEGIELDGRHYSMSLTDQLNMTALRTEIMDGAEAVLYHANGEAFEIYTKERFMEVYSACQYHKTKENTYFNQLKQYVLSLTDIEAVNAVSYGQPLKGEYLEAYNNILASVN